MSHSCPTCGQHLPQGATPVVDLDGNKVVMASGQRLLTPLEAEVLTVLAEAMPRFVTNDDIRRRVWGANVDRERHKPVYDSIVRLRRNLAGTRIGIESRYRLGYRLTTANG